MFLPRWIGAARHSGNRLTHHRHGGEGPLDARARRRNPGTSGIITRGFQFPLRHLPARGCADAVLRAGPPRREPRVSSTLARSGKLASACSWPPQEIEIPRPSVLVTTRNGRSRMTSASDIAASCDSAPQRLRIGPPPMPTCSCVTAASGLAAEHLGEVGLRNKRRKCLPSQLEMAPGTSARRTTRRLAVQQR